MNCIFTFYNSLLYFKIQDKKTNSNGLDAKLDKGKFNKSPARVRMMEASEI